MKRFCPALLASAALVALLALSVPGCVGTAGGETVDFVAVASGPVDAVEGQPLVFDTSRGWHVTLETARIHIGAIYLADSEPVSGTQATSCLLPGTYVAQVTQGGDFDLLSGAAQPFPVLGRGTTTESRSGQVWLTGGDVNEAGSSAKSTVVLRLSGTAELGDEVRPFDASLTIADNRVSSSNGAAGAAPICKQRIVSPIPTTVSVEDHGALWLRVDPRRLFTNVDFGALGRDDKSGDRFTFRDDSSDQPSANLYANLRQTGDLYDFTWVSSVK